MTQWLGHNTGFPCLVDPGLGSLLSLSLSLSFFHFYFSFNSSSLFFLLLSFLPICFLLPPPLTFSHSFYSLPYHFFPFFFLPPPPPPTHTHMQLFSPLYGLTVVCHTNLHVYLIILFLCPFISVYLWCAYLPVCVCIHVCTLICGCSFCVICAE